MNTIDTAGVREVLMDAHTPDGVALAGTLTLPPGEGPHPAALLLPGSGPVDRNSDAGRMKLALGGELARMLAERGVALFRYDRRGVGATPGDWRAAGFAQNREDAAAAMAALRARPEARTDAVAVIGHSEGALHAAALGARGGPATVVLLACPARPGEEVLLWQARMIGDDLPRPVALLLKLLRTDIHKQQAATIARIKATTTDVARVRGARVNARWMREFLVHDPRADLAAITVPVLAITGDKDLQSDPDDLEVIARLVPGPVQVRRVPDLTHLLRRDPRPASLRTYRSQLRSPVDPELLGAVAGWVADHLAERQVHRVDQDPA
ncbi:alpha/beta hydrolase [Pseudonocardia asaccharolytica]|uniref:Acyl-CoA thioester hydrolase n=1 Tax=Pseudonocardia asaccharolytica DSM 44247 = NBRC 16224 TaxID=1123024 RepID=A0A511CW46_9PSEU|nr:alpha/beta hydrolase [Pseudonocardia asaccharolytica]GEL16792.1 acyl-CoA thioester hydrolase [Pseudonocardia asaccharolytica DSM 44247 = NBRC 16224]